MDTNKPGEAEAGAVDEAANGRTELFGRLSEKHFRTAMEHSAIGMALVAPDGKWLKVNEALCRLVGYTQAELLRIDFQTITHPEDLDADMAQVRRMLAGEIETYHMEKRYIHKSGRIVWILLTVALARDGEGRPEYFISQIQDISQRRQAEEMMRRDAQIFAQLQDCVLCTDFAGRITYWNEAATRLHGWTAEEMHGNSIFEMFPAATRGAVEGEFAAFGERPELSGVFWVLNKDHSQVWVQIRVTRFRDESGKPAGYVVVARDMTERRLAEETIRRDAHILSQIKDAVICTDAAGQVLYWNEAAERLLGWKREEMLGQSILQRFPPEARQQVTEIRQRIMGGEHGEGMELEDYHKDGSRRWVRWQSYPIRDGAGQVSGIVTLATDISERRQVMQELVRAKEAAEAAARAKSQFLAVLSHEIRTPLNPIIGAAQLLLDEKCAPEQRELVETINNAGEHLLTLLNDMLDLAKMESGRMELALAPCVTQDLVRGVLDIKRNEARRKGLALSGEFDRKLAFCYLTDEPRLRQIMLNLVGNAVKFTQTGEVVAKVERLEREGARDQLRFSVRDTGIGMRAETMRRIFEPFYQVDSSSTRRYEGAGLGLAICRRLVEMMKGQIGVESRPEEGSTFWFMVDLERGPADLKHPERVNTASPFPGIKRVLLVEDDAQNRGVLVTMLQRADCAVTVAPTARAALELFKPGKFDAVLMDLRLPDLDGFETARLFRIREREAGAAPVPIIAQTANASARDMEAAKAAGMDDFLAKPIRRQRLLATLKRHIAPAGKAVGAGSPGKLTAG
jgi:PAS domain S-box-containing protein